MNESMKPNDITKRLENTKAPQIEVGHHRDQLRRALLQSHEKYSRPHSFSLDFGSLLNVMAPIAGVAVIAIIIVTGYMLTQDDSETTEQLALSNTNANTGTETQQVKNIFGVHGATAEPFATYKETAVTINPQTQPYTVQKNLQNVVNASEFTFTGDAEKKLVRNGFVVQPVDYNEFFSLYEQNRYNNEPNFITTDSILHNYHLVFEDTLKGLEENELRQQLETLTAEALVAAETQYAQVKGTAWDAAAQRNVVFFSVAKKLLNPNASVLADVATTVNAEIALIVEQNTIVQSPMMELSDLSYDEDYSQYTPRGHYTKSESLKQYFRTMMWYGRMTFRFQNEDEIRSAVLQEELLNSDAVHDPWAVLYETTSFFVGASDDSTYPAFREVVEEIYGEDATLESIVSETEKFDALVKSARAMTPPQINSMAIGENVEDRDAEILGFRFMGQRFTLDASIFQQLVCRSVGNTHGTMDCGGSVPDSRMLPKALDIPAAMGSDTALQLLKDQGDTEYEKYEENIVQMREKTASLDTKTWTQNLYWGWLYALAPLTDEQPEGYPSFMRNSAWELRDLNTYLGSWTELKHDTILYAKQVYAEFGGGRPDEIKVHGYVEPQPLVYARLASLMQMTSEGLELRGLLSASTKENLSRMQTLTLSLKTIAEKELAGETPTDEEYELIRSYGGQLEHFWMEANADEIEDSRLGAAEYLNQNPAAIVVDVATDPNGSVLEEAIGYISEIYVVVPVDGKLQIATGGAFSYYEFTQPLSDRLTDEAWRELLSSGNEPALPTWTEAFTASKD